VSVCTVSLQNFIGKNLTNYSNIFIRPISLAVIQMYRYINSVKIQIRTEASYFAEFRKAVLSHNDIMWSCGLACFCQIIHNNMQVIYTCRSYSLTKLLVTGWARSYTHAFRILLPSSVEIIWLRGCGWSVGTLHVGLVTSCLYDLWEKIINTILGLIETSSYDATYEPGNLLIISTRQNKSSLY
jgi:hypothetical protein